MFKKEPKEYGTSQNGHQTFLYVRETARIAMAVLLMKMDGPCWIREVKLRIILTIIPKDDREAGEDTKPNLQDPRALYHISLLEAKLTTIVPLRPKTTTHLPLPHNPPLLFTLHPGSDNVKNEPWSSQRDHMASSVKTTQDK